MILKLSLFCVLIFASPSKSEEVSPPDAKIPENLLPLTKKERDVVEHIVNGDHIWARKSILKLDPHLENLERLRFILKSVYIDTYQSFAQLKNFSRDSKNPIIDFNTLLTLYHILKTVRFQNEPNLDIEKQFVENSLVDVGSEILEGAILNEYELKKDHIDLVTKNLLTLDDFFYDQVISKISQKLASDYGEILTRMSIFFNHLESNRTSVTRARFDYFNEISNYLTYSAIGGSGKYEVIIQKGRYVVQALGSGSLKITQPQNINASAPIFWRFENVEDDLFYIRKRGDDGSSYLCAEEEGNYLKLHFKEQKCIWEVDLKENRFFFFNLAVKKYLCAVLNEPGSVMYFSSKEEVDRSFVSADRCAWEIKHWIDD